MGRYTFLLCFMFFFVGREIFDASEDHNCKALESKLICGFIACENETFL